MASFEQTKYCPNCKKNVSATKDNRCTFCNGKIERGTWTVRFRLIQYDGEKQKRLSGFKTKKEANQAYVDYISTHTYEKPTTFLDFDKTLNLYLINCKTNEYLYYKNISQYSFYSRKPPHSYTELSMFWYTKNSPNRLMKIRNDHHHLYDKYIPYLNVCIA